LYPRCRSLVSAGFWQQLPVYGCKNGRAVFECPSRSERFARRFARYAYRSLGLLPEWSEALLGRQDPTKH
jgi:hypothetical protein